MSRKPKENEDPDIVPLKDLEELKRIPTGILSLDCKIKGLPRGKLIRLHGPPSVGKSTLCYIFAKKAIELGHKTLIIDAEASLDREYLTGMGLDPSSVFKSEASTIKKAVATVVKGYEQYGTDFVIIDSVTALLPDSDDQEVIKSIKEDKDIGSAIGAHARQLSQYLKILLSYIAKYNITLLTIAQRRKNIDIRGFSTGEYITGGNAYAFYTHLSMDVSPVKELDRDETDPKVKYVKVTIDKNKTGFPNVSTILKLHIGKGIDETYDIFQFLLEKEIIKQSGAWMSIKNSDKKVRKSQVLHYIKGHCAEIKQECEKLMVNPDYELKLDVEKISESKTDITVDEEELESL